MPSNQSVGLTTRACVVFANAGGNDTGIYPFSERATAYVHVFGCRTSLCEGEYIAAGLISQGFRVTETLTDGIRAGVIVTCSVTHEADVKCRKLIRRVRRILGDDGVLAVCGCWAEGVSPDEARELGVDILAGNRGKRELPELVGRMLHDGRAFRDVRTSLSGWEELEIAHPVMHSRAFMKIQDGCNHFCTYCVIPFLRGRPVSRPERSVLSEVQRLIDNGVQEIVLTGIHLGIYGRDIDSSLSRLIREVSRLGLRRLRLGSLEPFCLNDELFDALGESESFCRHLHLPMQSGDDNVLAAMRRGYNADEFVRLCEKARGVLGSDLHISSDILVGFPGESEHAFTHTLDAMRLSGLGRVHVFPYSERDGTIASRLHGKVAHSVKVSRTARAIGLGRELYESYVRGFTGREVEVLVESDGRGYTREYVEALCDGRDNEIVRGEVRRSDNGRLECVRGD